MKHLFSILFLLMTFTSKFNFVFSQTQVSPKYSVDGKVNSLIAKGDTLIIGGTFNNVGVYTGGGALFGSSSDYPNLNFPKIIGSVKASTDDGAGGFYIYGDFRKETEATALSGKRIEHVRSDNSFDGGFSIRISASSINVLHYRAGLLYIGGSNVSQIGGVASGDLSAIDVTTGALQSWIPAIDSGHNIYCINSSASTLYIGGDFYKIGGQYKQKIAAIKLNTGAVTSWRPSITNSGYSDIKLYKNKVIVGGGFGDGGSPGTGAGSIKHGCALVDTVTGDTVQYVFDNAISARYMYWAASVQKLALNGDTLFVSSNGTLETRITAVDLAAGNSVIWKKYFSMNSIVSGMACTSGQLYVGGTGYDKVFKTDSPTVVQTTTNNAFLLDSRTGDFKTNWHPEPVGFNRDVNTLSGSGGNIFMGGTFTHVNGVERPGIVMLKTSTETVLPFYANIDKPFPDVKAMKLIDSTLYLAGQFYNINGSSFTSSVVSFNLNTGQLQPWHPANMGESWAIEADVANVYLGGGLTEPSGGSGRINLFAISRASGTLTTWAPNPNNSPSCLHIGNGNLYVGGQFTTISGQSRNRIASYDLSTLNLSPWNPNADGEIKAIALADSTIWVGGSFSKIGSTNVALFAGISSTTGNVTDTPVVHASTGNHVNAITIKGKWVIAGGGFKLNTSTACNNVAMYDAVGKVVFPSSSFCEVFTNSGDVNALSVMGTDLYLGGNFSNLNNKINATNIERIRYPAGFFVGGISDTVIGYYPQSGGNGGDVTINFWGERIKSGMHIKFTAPGLPDITVPDTNLYYPRDKEMIAIVDLQGKNIGQYDVNIVDSTGKNYFFKGGFQVMEGGSNSVEVSIVGPGAIRVGRPAEYILSLRNLNNNDKGLIPLHLILSKNINLSFHDKIISFKDSISDTLYYSLIDSFETDSNKVYWFLAPTVPAYSSFNIGFSIKSQKQSDFTVCALSVENYFTQMLPKSTTNSGPCMSAIQKYIADDIRDDDSRTKLNIQNCIDAKWGNFRYDLVIKYNKERYDRFRYYNLSYLDLLKEFSDIIGKCSDEFFTICKHPECKLGENLLKGYDLANPAKSFLPECKGLSDMALSYVKRGLSAFSVDPNDKYGIGIGTGHYITGKQTLSYCIKFENVDTAKLAGQVVMVVDTLDLSKLDLSTFELNLSTIGNRTINFTPGKFKISNNTSIDYLDLRPTTNLILKTDTKLNMSNGVFEAVFTSLDPTTMQLTTDPLLGFLPPDTAAPNGEGAIYFSVSPKAGLPNKTQISNKAFIYFDTNLPIETPAWINTLDTLAPVSKMNGLPASVSDTSFTISWKGNDGESGVEKYDIYYAVNNGTFQSYATNMRTTSIQFYGKYETTYSFYSIAIDSVGNREVKKDTAETKVKLIDNSDTKVYPNPSNGSFTVHVNSSTNPTGFLLSDIYGKSLELIATKMSSNDYSIQLPKSIPHGMYILKIKTDSGVLNKKIVVE